MSTVEETLDPPPMSSVLVVAAAPDPMVAKKGTTSFPSVCLPCSLLLFFYGARRALRLPQWRAEGAPRVANLVPLHLPNGA